MGSASEERSSPRPPEVVLLLGRIGELWITYVKGQLLLSVITGGITWAAGSAIGLPWSLWLGLLAGVLNTIPSIGPLIAVIPAAIIAFWQGSTLLSVDNWLFGVIVIGVYIGIQQITMLVIEPHVIGKRLDLPPLVVLVAVIVGAAVGSVAGAYLAVPLIATVREIARFTYNKVRGLPPFSEG